MADLDISALNDALGAYFRDNKKTVMQKLYSSEDARKHFQVQIGFQDEYVMTEIDVAEMIQPYQAGWTPKGDVAFKPEIVKARPFKVDFPFTPKKLEATWLGYLKTNGSSPEAYPFVQFIYDRIIERVARDVNKCTFQGVYVAPTPGTAGGAMTSYDGLITIAKAGRTAGKIATVATGAITTSNVVDKAEIMFDAVDEEFRDNPTVLIMNHTHLMYYCRKRRDSNYASMDIAEFQKVDRYIDFSNCKLLAPKYYNSNMWLLTIPENLIMVEDGIHEEEKMIVQADHRELHVMMDAKRGVGLGITTGYAWASDQN